MPHGRSLRYSSFNANDLLTYPFGFLSSLSNRSTHRGQTESNSSQQPNQHGDESDVYKDETGGRLAQASDFLNFLGSEPVAESSLASDSRREMIIKATTNIYDTQNISWPNSIVSNFVAKLALANELLSISSCPCLYGGQKLVALKSGSLLASLARNWGFSPSSIALGSTYFQRLVTVQGEGQIGQWVQASTDFRPYLSIVKSSKGRDKNELGPGIREKAELGLRSLFLCCLFLASKVHGKPIGPQRQLHRRFQSKIHGMKMSQLDVHMIEERVLNFLGWRLGPQLACFPNCQERKK